MKICRDLAAFVMLIVLSLVGCAMPPAAARSQPTGVAHIGKPLVTTVTIAPTATAMATAKKTAAPTARPSRIDGLSVVTVAELPREAQHTVKLIEQGGPFPYSRDGVVYQNRERILPGKPRSYYHEYTVVTPGSRDRGARRIIAGGDGELFYTDDHYASFVRVIKS